LSVYCRVTTIVLMRASFHNLRKVFSISRSTCTCLWLVERVTSRNRQENSKETNHSKERVTGRKLKVVQIE
jgi:membrane protein implicated in regulation of membrane protease activity